jgi:hypothetical protein
MASTSKECLYPGAEIAALLELQTGAREVSGLLRYIDISLR